MDLRIIIMVIGATGLVVSKKTKCPPNAKTCGDCLSANPMCAWCSGEIPSGNPRCHILSDLMSSNRCSTEDIVAPEMLQMTIRKSNPIRPKRPISPQKISLELRRGAKTKIPIEVFSQKESVSVKLRHPRAVQIKVESKCKGFEWKNKMATCKGLSRGKVKFKLIIKMKRCLPKPKKIKVTVDGNKKKTLKIALTTRCTCDCEKDPTPSAPQCSGRGKLSCGACSCETGYFGPTCECDADRMSPEEAIQSCSASNTSKVCSGRGRCICGQCECSSKQLYGRYCECDRSSCTSSYGQICGGSTRGTCMCGVCKCEPGYGGTACENSMATDKCISPDTREICNSQGLCVNNTCRCEGLYVGKTCDHCPTCPGMCIKLRPCIECFAFNAGDMSRKECLSKCSYMSDVAEIVDDIVDQERGEPRFRMCMLTDENDCLFKFAYNYQDIKRKRIKIERKKMCPQN